MQVQALVADENVWPAVLQVHVEPERLVPLGHEHVASCSVFPGVGVTEPVPMPVQVPNAQSELA